MERLRELFKSFDDKQALSNLKKLLIDQKEVFHLSFSLNCF